MTMIEKLNALVAKWEAYVRDQPDQGEDYKGYYAGHDACAFQLRGVLIDGASTAGNPATEAEWQDRNGLADAETSEPATLADETRAECPDCGGPTNEDGECIRDLEETEADDEAENAFRATLADETLRAEVERPSDFGEAIDPNAPWNRRSGR